jgi:two-component system chemotaxis response regulator CheB
MRSRKNPYRVLFADNQRGLSVAAAPMFASGELAPCGDTVRIDQLEQAVKAQGPSLIVLQLPKDESAFAAIEAVMAHTPTPMLVLHGGNEAAFRALDLGALDVVRRPDTDTADFWAELGKRGALLAQVRVLKHVRGQRARRAAVPTASTRQLPFRVVAIAASLGGPKALSVVLRALPHDFKAPILVCQHISDGFTEGMARWLAHECLLPVVEAQDGQPMKPGVVYLAPSLSHLKIDDAGRTRLDGGPMVGGFRPSCDVLLSSVASVCGKKALGVVLTGMGKDGARGLKDIRMHGGHTIAQDEATCVVYGMPREAVELGAAACVLPLDEIAPAMVKWVNA